MRNKVDPMPIYDDIFCESTTLTFKKEDVSALIPEEVKNETEMEK